MINVLYSEINIFCIFLLALLYFNCKKTRNIMVDVKLYLGLLIATIAVLILDTVSALIIGVNVEGIRYFNIVVCCLYYLIGGVISFLWLLYIDYKTTESVKGLVKRAKVYIIPLIFLAIMSFTSPITKAFFYINDDNIYIRGKLFAVYLIICYGYLVFSAFCVFKKNKVKKLPYDKKKIYVLFSFVLISIITGIFQSVFLGLPLLWVAVTATLVMIYINLQNSQITIDALTNTNNRGHLNKYLSSKLSTLKTDEYLFLFLIDIDNFKSINDNFGHQVGDAALIQTSQVLKRVCGKSNENDFLARYGGDEFAIVSVRKNRRSIEKTFELIDNEIIEENKKAKNRYKLSLSVGYAEYAKGIDNNIDDLISRADAHMYEKKNYKRNNL